MNQIKTLTKTVDNFRLELEKQWQDIESSTELETHEELTQESFNFLNSNVELLYVCLLYTSPSPRDGLLSRMPSSA